MLETSSERFRLLFLLKFTEEMIKNSRDIEIIRLREILHQVNPPEKKEEKKLSIKEEVKQKLNEKKNIPKVNLREDPFFASPSSTNSSQSFQNPTSRDPFSTFFNPRPSQGNSRPVLRVPKQRYSTDPRNFLRNAPPLPETVRDIRPVPNPNILVDLLKLNPFINDRNVHSIEVSGDEEFVYVEGTMGKKPTNIKLTKEEIEEIIDNFSKEAKIPKNEGLFKVVVGNLMLMAMVSSSVCSRFVIKKII